MSEIYLIRHAQASYMSDNYDKLSPKGETQSTILGKYLATKNIHFDQTFVGTLSRQKKTLDLVHAVFQEKNTSHSTPSILKNLNEHSGPKALRASYEQLITEDEWVRQLHEQAEGNPKLLRQNTMIVFKHFMHRWVVGDFASINSEIEPWSEFRTRVRNALQTILDHTNKGERIGVFTSGGVIAAMTAEALGLTEEPKVADLNYAVRNTSISKFLFSKGTLNLLSFNEVPHLEKEMITFV